MDDADGLEDVGSHTLRELLADRALVVILTLSFVGAFGNGVASPAMPGIVESLSVSEAQIGLILSVFFVGGMIALPLAGFLMDAYGRRPVILSLVFLFGAGGTAILFVRSFELILLCRFVQGVGFAGTIPLSVTLIGDRYSGPSGSSAQGLRFGSIGLAEVLIPAVAGLLTGLAWFAPFFLNAFGLVIFVLAYLYLPETREPIEASAAGEARSPYRERAHVAVKKFVAPLSDLPLLVLLGGVFLIFLARFSLITFVPLYTVQKMDASYFLAGLAISVVGIPRLLVSPFAGSFDGRLSRRMMFATTISTLGVGILLVGFTESVVTLFAVLLLHSVGDALYNPILNNTVTGMADERDRGRVTSIMEVLKTGAIALSPAVFGMVLSVVGYEQMFAAAGLLALFPLIPTVFILSE